jgi:hypothetical protein
MNNKNKPRSMFIGLISLVVFGLIVTLILQNRLITPDTKTGQALEIDPYPSPIAQVYPKSAQVSSSQPYPAPILPTESLHLPLCSYKSDAELETEVRQTINYYFSEPQIVLEVSQNINIVEWLPDNQHILLTQEDFPRQKIELFEPETKDIRVLASRRIVHTPPVWLPTLNTVVYTEMNIMDATKQPVIFTRQIWMRQKDNVEAYKIADEISNFSISADTRSDRFVYLGTKQLITQNPKSAAKQMVTIDPLQWTIPDEPDQDRSFDPPYNLVWRPGSSQIAFYSEKGLFLVDADNGEVCEVDMEGWAGVARWSPDGRYLAMVRTWGALPVKSTELAVLDMKTGKISSFPVIPDIKVPQLISDIAWAPDNRHLVIIGEYYPDDSAKESIRGLYLVNIVQASGNSIKSPFQLGGGEWGTNIAWSPDGSKLIIACPTQVEERLCLINVRE